MVKLRLQSPFKPANQGRRRSTRIQEQQQRQQEAERKELERQASMIDETSKTSPGQRRSFDDINSSNIRRILTGNKKTRRSTSAAGRNGVIRRAATMFRPSSRGLVPTLVTSSSASFEAIEVSDTSSGSFDVVMADEQDNVLSWMQTNAPPDVLPRILSFCGSRKVNALSRVNKAWNKLITTNDLVWRVMCEDTHKVRDVACRTCLFLTIITTHILFSDQSFEVERER